VKFLVVVEAERESKLVKMQITGTYIVEDDEDAF
jgi:hypothetical protein